jgi:hypothetical protein
MNRPLLIAAFALLFASVSVAAQRGGGGHGGGGHAGFGGGGGFGGHMGGGHAFSGARSGGFAGRSYGARSFAPRSYSRGYYGRNSAFGRGSFGRFGRNRSGIGLRIRSYPYGYNCWGGYCGYGYGYGGWGYPYLGGGVDPYWWWDNDNGDSDSNSSADQAAPYGYDDGLANQMQQQGVPMRPAPDYDSQGYGESYGGQNYHARSVPPAAPPQQQEHAQAAPPTVLIFRDQHQEQVQNYAIVGQTLWNFSAGHTQKIPLSDLDIPATQKANEDQGIEFRLPASSEGQ